MNKSSLVDMRSRWARLMSLSWRDVLVITLPLVIVLVAAAWAAVRFVRLAPPSTIHMLAGADGSSYRTMAEKYKKIIEGFGVKVELIPSRGSLDNLQKLANPAVKVDVGFVQGGMTDGVDISRLVSLGSLFEQPLYVYYRGPERVELISELKGRRIATGPEGSGTRVLALKILKANGIEERDAELREVGGEDAVNQLVAGTIDAAFLMGDSVTYKVLRRLREAAGIELMSFRQAEGYVRRLRFLHRLVLPEGAQDLGKNYPPHMVELVGPNIELVARDDLHPALSDLLISAARQVHGSAGLFREAGEFPAPLLHDFPISRDAERYYKSGTQFLYKKLPFWLANLVDRLVVLVLPLLVLLVPAVRIAPGLYRWRVRSRLYRWYGALMTLEREMLSNPDPEQRQQLLARLDGIQRSVGELRLPLAFADQLYVLRDHVAMVRQRLIAQAT